MNSSLEINTNDYIQQMKGLQSIILHFIEKEEEDSQTTNIFKDMQILQNRKDIKLIITILIKISNNHHRTPNFFTKIKQILIDIKPMISQHFTNTEIFNLFKSNKYLLLYLIEEKVITIDDQIIDLILEIGETAYTKYSHYFYPEIKTFLNEKTQKAIEEEILTTDSKIFENEDFKEKRKTGENHSFVSNLIRNDSVVEFIKYLNIKQFSPSSLVKRSIFETNSIILKKQPTLIEYAAFCGSIQIFQYLQNNKATISPNIWYFVIHSQNAELFGILEELKIEMPENSVLKILEESIKCHHNDFVSYIIENIINGSCNDLNEKLIEYSIHYYNYSFLPINFNYKLCLLYSFQFRNFQLVNLLLQIKNNEIYDKLIFKHKCI